MNENTPDIWRGVGAVVLNAIALLTSREEHFEFALRCTSLIVGIVVGMLTIAVLILRFTRKRKRDDD